MVQDYKPSDGEHPITPPPELVQQWLTEGHHQDYCSAYEYAIAKAARWGADQELEACCQWAAEQDRGGAAVTEPVASFDDELRAARRSKLPSLKEQALADLDTLVGRGRSSDTIRRALEQLDD